MNPQLRKDLLRAAEWQKEFYRRRREEQDRADEVSRRIRRKGFIALGIIALVIVSSMGWSAWKDRAPPMYVYENQCEEPCEHTLKVNPLYMVWASKQNTLQAERERRQAEDEALYSEYDEE